MYNRLSRAVSISSTMDSHKPQECKICLEYFDSKGRRPRSLPCGHTFCTLCIADLIKNMKISCPHCRAKHILKQATELPISYIVEEFMAREKHVGSIKATTTKTCQTIESGSTVDEKSCSRSLDWSAASFNRVACVSISNDDCCCCFCSSSTFRKVTRCLPNWMKLKRRMWRREPASSVREISVLRRASRIYAVKEENNRVRSAIMSLQDGRMYLHYLRNLPAPSTRTLKHSDMVALLDTSSTVAFMDLAWSGMVKGRILIELYTNTSAGQIFLKLCTGEEGPSYANTNFLEVHYKDRPGEYILAGGSLNSAEIHSKLSMGSNASGDIMCQTTGKAGLVWGRSSTDISRFGQFSITTRDPSQSVTYMQVLGRVKRGLEVVAIAAQQLDITEVKVVDCGVLVPL